jgi:UDP-N-acetylglucosamine diphosphorylase/glucosamine-1-phosphate N-acetyltransferase
LSEFSAENLAFHPSLFEGATVCIFEDEAVEIDLFPLTVLRPVWELLAGTGTILEHVRRASGRMPILRPRPHMERLCAERWPEKDTLPASGDVVFLNGRLFEFRPERLDDFRPVPDTVQDGEGRLLYARRPVSQAQQVLAEGGNFLRQLLVQKTVTTGLPRGWRVKAAAHLWDIMVTNAELLHVQLGAAKQEFMDARPLRAEIRGIELCNRENGATVFVSADVQIHPGVVFGNHKGPIYIGRGTEIQPHSYLEGPLFVGPDCVIKAGTRLYGGSSFGPVCRLGGEITRTIVQGYSNKQHEGFLGDAYLGEWVNLGAGTNNSNLKNNYTSVKVEVGGKLLDTGHQHIGCFLGDHTKTAIGTILNTGTVVGIGCNLLDAGFPPRLVPSFHWGKAEHLLAVPLNRVLETARLAMARRGKALSQAEGELLHRHYERIVKKEK